MTTITINECVYKVHPIYDLYAADSDGNLINIITKVPHKWNKSNRGYMKCRARKHGQKDYYVHRFIYECFNNVIPDGKEIDHINNIRDDNRLFNLQLLTPSENTKKLQKIEITHLLLKIMKIENVLKQLIKIQMKFHIITACIRFNNTLV